MKNLAHRFQSDGDTIHILDMLRCVFEDIGDRGAVDDAWLQHQATAPPSCAIKKYQDSLRLHKQRNKGAPRPPLTLRQAFKEDREIRARVEHMLKDEGATGPNASKRRTRILGNVFEEAEETSGGLDAFYHVIELDKERYSQELKKFREKQNEFDRENGLAPRKRSKDCADSVCV